MLVLDRPEQHKALGNVVRHQILGLLNDRAATITQLAEALGVLKGSASFHLRTLERAGLVRVVRRGEVRGGVERYYGRTARRFETAGSGYAGSRSLLRNALAELDGAPSDDRATVAMARGRLRADQIELFRDRLEEVLVEFGAKPGPDEPMWALLVAMYPTGLPVPGAALPGDSQLPGGPA
jgi:DNA-binding transcriptional ArsR family regulator